MAVQFKVVPKRNPAKLDDPPKYYAQPVSRANISLRQVAKEIANASTVSVIDTLAVLEAFIETIPKELLRGNKVKLGDFGSFSITLKSEPAVTAEEVKSSQVSKTRIIFRPGKLVTEQLNNIEFEKIS